jgi:hypothetical protein
MDWSCAAGWVPPPSVFVKVTDRSRLFGRASKSQKLSIVALICSSTNLYNTQQTYIRVVGGAPLTRTLTFFYFIKIRGAVAVLEHAADKYVRIFYWYYTIYGIYLRRTTSQPRYKRYYYYYYYSLSWCEPGIFFFFFFPFSFCAVVFNVREHVHTTYTQEA